MATQRMNSPADLFLGVVGTNEEDFSSYTPEERVDIYRTRCQAYGVRPELIPFKWGYRKEKEGKKARLDLYPTRAFFEQLRTLHNISIRVLRKDFSKVGNDVICIVEAVGRLPNGREETNIGVETIRSSSIATDIKKAYTGALNRVTGALAGCGSDAAEDLVEQVTGFSLLDVDLETGEVLDDIPDEIDVPQLPSDAQDGQSSSYTGGFVLGNPSLSPYRSAKVMKAYFQAEGVKDPFKVTIFGRNPIFNDYPDPASLPTGNATITGNWQDDPDYGTSFILIDNGLYEGDGEQPQRPAPPQDDEREQLVHTLVTQYSYREDGLRNTPTETLRQMVNNGQLTPKQSRSTPASRPEPKGNGNGNNEWTEINCTIVDTALVTPKVWKPILDIDGKQIPAVAFPGNKGQVYEAYIDPADPAEPELPEGGLPVTIGGYWGKDKMDGTPTFTIVKLVERQQPQQEEPSPSSAEPQQEVPADIDIPF